MSAIDRRTALQLGLALAAAPATLWSAKADELLRRRIPSSGESLPMLGLGTNNYSPRTPEERAARRAVLERFNQLGASVIDTAPAYRESEVTLGELLGELGTRDRSFIATIPRDLDEAAIIDGAKPLQVFFRVILPLLKPVTVTLIVVQSIAIFNDFTNPLYYLPGR